MKKFLQIVMVCLIPMVSFTQTPDEKLEITGDYDKSILKELADKYQAIFDFEKNKATELAKEKGWDLTKEVNGVYYELMKVTEEGEPLYYITNNVNAAISTRANTLHNGGLLGLNVEGQNMTAHVWDAGLARITHQEYDGPGGNNRFSVGDGTTGLHFHAAHVTGTIIASGFVASAKGMAPQGYAVGYDWNNDKSEATSAAGSGMLLSNHSYGWGASSLPDWYFGAYLSESRDWDVIMHNAPYYLMVCSAGNDGNDNSSNGNPLEGNSSYDKLSSFKTSKNSMVVANGQDANIDASGNLISVSINSGSSEGPTDDYRIKPDITGNGTELYSTLENANNSYGTLTGTSMASPNVCGTLLLLQQHYNNINSGYMRAATLKGLALHTADDAGPAGPDAVYGWGLLNAKAAANVISNNGSTSLISELTLTQGNSYTINVASDGVSDLVASISWTDPPGTANTGTPNDNTPVLVNDLDIRVTQGTNTYYPYRLTSVTTNGTGDNIVDPFEKIIISGASGSYTLTVSHKGTLSGGSQDYTLIVTGKTIPTGPPVADFVADNTMPVNSFTTVNFTDLSSNVPTSWSWSFSPNTVTYIGSNSNSQNPSVRFNSPGAYTVTLYVSNAYGNDTETKTAYIHMGQSGQWTGATSTNWNVNTNWENHLVPGSTDHVSITPAAFSWPTKTGNLNIGTDCGGISLAMNAQLTVTGDLTIQSGRQLYCDANATVYVGGDWTNNGTFTPGTGLVVFNGTGTSIINSPSGGPIYLINDNFSSWPGNWNGDLGGSYGQFSQQSSSYAGGTLPEARFLWDNNTNATRRMYHNALNTSGLSSLSLSFRHNIDHYSGSGTYTCKVQYSTDAVTWYDAGWSVSPSSNISATQVSLNLTGAQGVGATNYYLSFTITGNLFNINYWYIDDVQLSYPASGIEIFNNLEINKINTTVSTNGDINVNGAIVIRPGAYFTNSIGDNFNVLGSTLFMADPTGMASFIDNGTSTFAFPPQVQLFMTPDSWHFVSSPVQGALSGLFTNYYLYSFDEPTDSWVNIIPTNVPLDIMQGYSVWVPANPAMVTFSGTLNNGALSIPVTRNTTQTDQGWNLVGNPYPSSLDWNSAAWTKTNVNNTIYYYSGAGGLNNYKYYIGAGGETPYPGVGVNTGTNLIPPLQGFFVHASGSGTLGVNNNARIHSNQAYYKTGDDMSTDWPLIRIVAEANGLTDETVIRFLDAATPEFDGDSDALKLFAATYPQVWSVYGATDYAVNTLPEVHDDLVIPVSFVNPETTDYSLYFSEINGMPGQVLFLEDLLLGEIHEIEENKPVVFNYTSSQSSDRFLLHFSHPLGAIENQASSSSIYSHGNVVYIHLHEEVNAEIVVHDLIGREILRENTGREKLIRLDLQSDTGYYLVSVRTPDHTFSKKVFLR